MKTCSYCKESRPLEMYYLSKNLEDWHRNICIDCARQYGRLRYHIRKTNPVVEVEAPKPRMDFFERVRHLFI